MQEPLDILKRVQRTEAPPFLFTRIEAQLEYVKETRLTPKFALAVCSVLLLVVSLNFYIINNSREEQPNKNLSYSETSLSPEYNSLY